MALPDGQVGEEGQQEHHQGHLNHVLGGHKRQVSGDPTFYDVSSILLQLLTLALAGSLDHSTISTCYIIALGLPSPSST